MNNEIIYCSECGAVLLEDEVCARCGRCGDCCTCHNTTEGDNLSKEGETGDNKQN